MRSLVLSSLLTTLTLATDEIAGLQIDLCCPSGEIFTEVRLLDTVGRIENRIKIKSL